MSRLVGARWTRVGGLCNRVSGFSGSGSTGFIGAL